jgi:hypothetical protein
MLHSHWKPFILSTQLPFLHGSFSQSSLSGKIYNQREMVLFYFNGQSGYMYNNGQSGYMYNNGKSGYMYNNGQSGYI